MNFKVSCLLFVLLVFDFFISWCQKTQICGFMEVHNFHEGSVHYSLGNNLNIYSSTDGLTVIRQTNSDLSSVFDPHFIAGYVIVLGYYFKQNYSLGHAQINPGILSMVIPGFPLEPLTRSVSA